jgi:hypothetical protein
VDLVGTASYMFDFSCRLYWLECSIATNRNHKYTSAIYRRLQVRILSILKTIIKTLSSKEYRRQIYVLYIYTHDLSCNDFNMVF